MIICYLDRKRENRVSREILFEMVVDVYRASVHHPWKEKKKLTVVPDRPAKNEVEHATRAPTDRVGGGGGDGFRNRSIVVRFLFARRPLLPPTSAAAAATAAKRSATVARRARLIVRRQSSEVSRAVRVVYG